MRKFPHENRNISHNSPNRYTAALYELHSHRSHISIQEKKSIGKHCNELVSVIYRKVERSCDANQET